ncbi:MAG TPA: ABC transporter permease [Streptosporangiaceae bacterium]|nr:ABC transporter permease [Streptosporangiaceae bacterium]
MSDDKRQRDRGATRASARAARAELRGDGRLSAPGQLLQGGGVNVSGVLTADLPAEPLADYATAHGLRPSASRPPVPAYLRQLWRRWSFIAAFATARNIAMYTEARLGQLWQVLTPLLNVAVYWLIFGIILHTSRGIPHFISFLVVGVFVFTFTQRSFISSSKVITSSLPLIRALQFPRASLPLGYVMIELQQMALSMGVMIVIILFAGEPITWYWFLAIPVLLLQTIFNVGVGLLVARLGSQVNDFSQLLPFLLRTWMYMSGVMFSLQTLSHVPEKLIAVLQINPAALYITLMRNAMLVSARTSAPGHMPYDAARCAAWQTHGKKIPLDWSAYCHPVTNPAHYWYYAIGWAVLALVVGFFFFWRAEARYGRG